MVAAVLEGDITLTILLLPTPQTSREKVVKFARENSTTEVIGPRRWIKHYTENIEPESVIFVNQVEVKMQIHAVNKELPDELVDLLTRNFFRHVYFLLN